MSTKDLNTEVQNYKTDGGNTDEIWGAFRMNGADCKIARGSYAVLAADVTATHALVATGLNSVAVPLVQIMRSGKVATSDAAVSLSGESIEVGSGSTYTLTAGDVINWIAIGS
jgi:hypothetical protein